MKEFNIYVGLNDAATHKQLFDTEAYISILKDVCKYYKVPFSFEIIQGGYIHDDGEYINETALHIVFFNQTRCRVNEIAEDLCTFFNQESVIVTSYDVDIHKVEGDRNIFELVHSDKSSL